MVTVGGNLGVLCAQSTLYSPYLESFYLEYIFWVVILLTHKCLLLNRPISISGKSTMSNNNRVFIIAEVGSNWRMGTRTRDLHMARSLVDVASESGADAIKFQTYKANSVYVPGAGNPKYLGRSGLSNSIDDLFSDLAMPYEIIPELAEYCRLRKIEFMSTPFSISDAEAIDPFVRMHKIASYEISHLRLIQYVAHTGKPIILSTGASTYQDIELAMKWFHEAGGKSISLLQNTAKYPAGSNILNLKVIPDLIRRYKIPVGLSDHSLNPIVAPVCAVALGASIIEKHLTLHNRLPGPDHFFAITPPQFTSMVQAIRSAEECLGSDTKVVQIEEEELKRFACRSIQALKSIKKGDKLEEGINIDIMRPGNKSKGIHPKYLLSVVGKKATRDIHIGEGVLKGDYE
jgi:sialic acid synthase SpsE